MSSATSLPFTPAGVAWCTMGKRILLLLLGVQCGYFTLVFNGLLLAFCPSAAVPYTAIAVAYLSGVSQVIPICTLAGM